MYTFMTQLAVQFSTSLNICFCTTWEKQNIKINKKLYKISFFQMWPPTANQL